MGRETRRLSLAEGLVGDGTGRAQLDRIAEALDGGRVLDGIMRRDHRHRSLIPDEIARNCSLVLIDCAIEGVFGALKRSYG